MEYDWDGVPLVISRTGWSSELGYEIFFAIARPATDCGNT